MTESRQDTAMVRRVVVPQMQDIASRSEAKKTKNQVVRSAHAKWVVTARAASGVTLTAEAALNPLKYAAIAANAPAQKSQVAVSRVARCDGRSRLSRSAAVAAERSAIGK